LDVSNVSNPTGLVIGGSGTGTITLSGKPTASGTVMFKVTPTDDVGTSASTTYSFFINPAMVLAPATLPPSEIGFAYSTTTTASGGNGPIRLSLSSITNPSGLTIGGDGTDTITIDGTPTTTGTVSFIVTASDSIGTAAGKSYSFTVSPPVSVTPLTIPD